MRAVGSETAVPMKVTETAFEGLSTMVTGILAVSELVCTETPVAMGRFSTVVPLPLPGSTHWPPFLSQTCWTLLALVPQSLSEVHLGVHTPPAPPPRSKQ